MPIKRVKPEDAKRLLDEEGYVYVDVRSVPEFEAGHPEGAYNVPWAHMGPSGMTPNGAFLAAMERTFAKDTKIVVGCKSGGRSLKAAEVLERAGFSAVVDQLAGYSGAPDAFGRMVEPGWQAKGLPTASAAGAGRAWRDIEPK